MLGDIWTVTSEAGDELTQTRPFDGSQQAFSLLGGAFGVTSSLRGAVWVSFPELDQIHPYGRDGLDLLPGKAINVGASPHGIAVDRLDRVWVACRENHRLYYIDPAGRNRFSRSLAINPYAVAVDQDGDCWVTCTGGGKLYEITNTNALYHDIEIGDSPMGVAVDTEGNVWVAMAGDLEATQGFVKKISQAGEELGTFEVGFRPNGVAVDASGRVWVANEGDILTNPGSSVTALDLSGNLLGNYTVGVAPNSVSIGGDGTVWVTNGGTPFAPASSLMQLNPETGEILAQYVLPDRSVSFGDATGYQAAMRVDPLGDADGDNASNLSEMTEGGDPFNPFLSPNSDCNGNDIPDVDDIGTISEDCNGNSIPDECDIGTISNDCNGNDIPDECDVVFGGFSTDCNANGIPDECDVQGNSTLDLNGNGVLDDCECLYLSYCAASPNSTGNGAVLIHSGTLSCLLNNVTLITTHCPANKFGIYFYGSGQVSIPFGDGALCAGSPYARLPVIFTGPNGVGAYSMDFDDNTPLGMHIDPHETWNFQFWFRDPNGPLGNGFNLSNGLELTFCP
jgi:streptogramin lyase